MSSRVKCEKPRVPELDMLGWGEVVRGEDGARTKAEKAVEVGPRAGRRPLRPPEHAPQVRCKQEQLAHL